jgi:hypothetical protein
VERTGWWQRIVQFIRWEPSTYTVLWLSAPLRFGVPGFVIVLAFERGDYHGALASAASITFFGGLIDSKGLNRRRQGRC